MNGLATLMKLERREYKTLKNRQKTTAQFVDVENKEV